MWKLPNKEKILNTENAIIVFCALAFFFVLFFSVFTFSKISHERMLSQSLVSSGTEKKDEINPFDEIEITAKAAYVWDIKNQKPLFELDSEKEMPIASITKVMTAIIVYENGLDGSLKIGNDSINQEGDSGLLLDEVWKIKDLLQFSLLVSSNDGVYSLSRYVGEKIGNVDSGKTSREIFVGKMNEKAKELGLKNTNFKNESGLDENENEAGALSSARDISLLMEYVIRNYPDIFYPTKFNNFTFESLSGFIHQASNTNTETNKFYGLIASKTGFTDIAGGNLTVVIDPILNRPIVISVLGSTLSERFNDTLKLVKATLAYLENESN